MADRIVVDPVTGEYVQYDEAGNEVARWYGLPPISSASSEPTNLPNTGTTTIGPRGEIVQPRAPARDPLTAEPVAPLAGPAPTVADATGGGWREAGGRGAWYGGSGSGQHGYGDDPFANLPAYQNGMQHPAQSGVPLTPGGVYNDPNVPGTGAQQVYVPGGAQAGPYGTSAAPPPSTPAYGGGGSSGGGGGSNMGANSDIGQKLEAKVRGMAAKIQGGGSSSSTDSSYMADQRQYARTGKKIDRAYERYNKALAEPNLLPVRGWSKQQGYKPGTISSVLSDPTLLLPDALPGYTSNQSPYSEQLESYPLTDLAMIVAGTQGRQLLSKTPVDKVPHILRKEADVRPTKPEYKRTLDPSKVANQIASMWQDLGTSGGDASWLDHDALIQNLATAKKKSALMQGLRQQFTTDPNAGLASVRSYLKSAITAGPDDALTRAAWDTADRRITSLGSDLLRLKPKKAATYVRDLANSFR